MLDRWNVYNLMNDEVSDMMRCQKLAHVAIKLHTVANDIHNIIILIMCCILRKNKTMLYHHVPTSSVRCDCLVSCDPEALHKQWAWCGDPHIILECSDTLRVRLLHSCVISSVQRVSEGVASALVFDLRM